MSKTTIIISVVFLILSIIVNIFASVLEKIVEKKKKNAIKENNKIIDNDNKEKN